MKINDLMSLEDLQWHLDNKYVKKEKHPSLDLWIYNYGALTQFGWVWNDVTLNCRGLIIDGEDNIVARPFKKFFSYEQLGGKLPEGEFVIEEKMDGSMLIVVNYEGNIVTATRGSFISDQAKKGKELLPKGFLPREGQTWIFEVIYKENRIVVDYDFEGLVLLTVVEPDGREWLTDKIFRDVIRSYEFKVPKIYSFGSLEKILSYEESNFEGFVLRYACGERVKVKLEEYKRLHRLITGVSEKTVWEAMRDDKIEELLEGTPDEFYDFVQEVKAELQNKYDVIEKEAKNEFVDLGDRKTNALHYATCKYPSILFHMLDGRDYSNNIWKMVKPETTRVFKMINEDAN